MKSLHIFILCWICLILRCTSPLSGNGGGTEITNGRAAGRALLPDGTAAAHARVTIRNANYTPALSGSPAELPGSWDTFTDGAGFFTVRDLDTGTYFLEINDDYSYACAFEVIISRNNLNAELGTATLTPHATLAGSVENCTQTMVIQIPGLERSIEAHADGSYIFPSLPAGEYYLLITCLGEQARSTVSGAVTAVADSITTIPHIGWGVTYIFSSVSEQAEWGNPENWSPQGIPGRHDTALISAKTCILPDEPVDAVVIVRRDGEIAAGSDTRIYKTILEGGTLSAASDSSNCAISTHLQIDSTSTLNSKNLPVTLTLLLTGEISGGGDVICKGTGTTAIHASGETHRGDWTVIRSKLRARSDCFTTGSILVDPGSVLDNENPLALSRISQLTLQADSSGNAKMEMDATATVRSLIMGDDIMPPGAYSRSTHPDFFIKDREVTVTEVTAAP